MRELLMVLFLLGTVGAFCNAQIDGYCVKDSGNLVLFADEEPRTSNSISIGVGELMEVRFTQPSTGDFLWQKMDGSDYIQFNLGGSGHFASIWTQSASEGDSAVFYVADKSGGVPTITVRAY